MKWRQILYRPTKRRGSQFSLQEIADHLSSVNVHGQNSLFWWVKQGEESRASGTGHLLIWWLFPDGTFLFWAFIAQDLLLFTNPDMIPNLAPLLGSQPCFGTLHSRPVSTPAHRDYFNISSSIFPSIQVKTEGSPYTTSPSETAFAGSLCDCWQFC